MKKFTVPFKHVPAGPVTEAERARRKAALEENLRKQRLAAAAHAAACEAAAKKRAKAKRRAIAKRNKATLAFREEYAALCNRYGYTIADCGDYGGIELRVLEEGETVTAKELAE